MSTQIPPQQNGEATTRILSSPRQDDSRTHDQRQKIDDDIDFDSAAENVDDTDDVDTELLSAYRHLSGRHVDLVGDYAGDELFLIDGDSMLLRCFEDNKLDFTSGLQLLHAVYNVENFLHQLVKRKCNFSMVFFNSNRGNCVPANVEPTRANLYFVARAAIIRHLKTTLPKVHPRISVLLFESWRSEDFLAFLERTSPYFIMAHDGATRTDPHASQSSQALPVISSSNQRLRLREMIMSFAASGFNIALINGLEWRDTKVMTMVLEARRTIAGSAPTDRVQSKPLPSLDMSEDIRNIANMSHSLSERQIIISLTVAQILRRGMPEIPAEMVASLCAALLLHQAILAHLPLSARRLPTPKPPLSAHRFLQYAAYIMESILNHRIWHDGSTESDVMDLVDGRLFFNVYESKPNITPTVKSTFEALLELVASIVDARPLEACEPPQVGEHVKGSATQTKEGGKAKVAVLPFTNKVFDKHLESVKIDVHKASDGPRSLISRKVFKEVSHWHNAKRPLVQKAAQPLDAKKEFWIAKRNQLFMAEMRTYAASLTNAVGKSLEPETIITGVPRQSTIRSVAQSPADSDASDSGSSAVAGRKQPGQKKGAGGKTAAKNAGKLAMMSQIAAAKAKKDEFASDKIVSSWQVVCKNFEVDADVRSRYRKAKEYLTKLQPSWKDAVGVEVELYLVNCLLHYWIEACRRKEKAARIQVAALIWSHVRSISQGGPLNKTAVKSLQLTVDKLGLPPVKISETTTDRKLSFTFALPTPVADLSINLPSMEFQLLQCGPYLERSFDSKPDPRVDFEPDGWQRDVLDTIDQEKSVFVVAPTSAGKTFISFYAMRKVLEADDDGVLVYVAPTKALVNQIAAEIQARYSKKFKHGGKSVWAIHTRDYRINSPTGCQVLVTVPHVLQIMLLAPSNANSWSSRVKRIIFDEIHSIGQAEDGVVWEQLLLMAPCPIIALSATVGNPNEFSDWLISTQSAIGKELQTVHHPHRYSDLRKYYFVPPERFAFQGIPDKLAFGSLGLEGLPGFNYIHPVAGLVDKSRGIPEDLALEPRDCWFLWQAMKNVQDDKHPIPSSLDPHKALPENSRKKDILRWEKALKDLLKSWLDDTTSPYDKLVHELEHGFRKKQREPVYNTAPDATMSTPLESSVSASSVVESTLPMLCRLQEQDALPAILFNYDRHECENVCEVLLEQLKQAELEQRKSGPRWERTLERWEEWKELKQKNASKTAKFSAKKTKKGKDDETDEKTSKLDMQRDASGGEDTKWESFDPEAPVEGYHFADHTRAQASELEVYVRQLRRRDVRPWLIDALSRGIGVHHAGMNRKYRQVVEILFRKGFVRVVIATGTLALGINMPCKTVVFSGDSVFLTALNYRQCAGRAGRRGFDLLGNVVFQGISRQKVCRLLSSRLPDLNGHFPITTTLVLRLFTLLHESHGAKYAVSAINALLSQPRLYLGGASFKDQTMHHLRFSIEYLRRQQLLGSDGVPLNFAGLVSHLYFTENSSFAFHALLKEGFFHEICHGIHTQEKATLETLMLVLSHLFGRIICRQADFEFRENVVKPSSSIVFLPPLPKLAAQILKEHNQQTLEIFKGYVKTFVDQHIDTDDRVLPLTGVTAGVQGNGEVLPSLPPTSIRSPFVALSGAGDDFDDIHDLCQTARDGVFLEEAVIPHVGVYGDETNTPLNAYLLDFFKHGDVETIDRANRVRRADIWFLLNDFSLVLATIITSLANFMKLTDGDDLAMLDVMGRLDTHEEEEDDKMAAVEQQSEVSGPSVADSGVVLADRSKPAAPTKKQAKNAESWEDLAGDDDDDDDEFDSTTNRELGAEAEALAEELSAWDGEGSEGLRDILKAFQKLHAEFNVKFKAMWA